MLLPCLIFQVDPDLNHFFGKYDPEPTTGIPNTPFRFAVIPLLCFRYYVNYLQVDESSRQREEINSLLAQVCDLQSRVQRFSHENDDLTANLRVYQVRTTGRRLPPPSRSEDS